MTSSIFKNVGNCLIRIKNIVSRKRKCSGVRLENFPKKFLIKLAFFKGPIFGEVIMAEMLTRAAGVD